MSKLSEFVDEYRFRLSDQDNNVFAFSWAKVFRRWGFMEIVEARYMAASAAFVANSEAVRKAMPTGTAPVSPKLAVLLDEGRRLSADLHLQIESYYLFAKIVLDDVARAIEFFFGPVRRHSLDSHDKWAKRAPQYAAAKGLLLPEGLIPTIDALKKRVCDHRDQQIAHEKSPRTMQGTMWDGKGGAKIVGTRLYPRNTDPPQSDGETPSQLRSSLEAYFDLVADFLSANEAKTNLKVQPG